MTIPEFKEMITNGMKDAFKEDGFLRPMAFFLIDGDPVIVEVPDDFMEDSITKKMLSDRIKDMCQMPEVQAGAFVVEAFAAKFDMGDEVGDKVIEGEVKVSDCDEKFDIIMMIFSSPIEETLVSYHVNPEDKSIGEIMDVGGQFSGLFSSFFNWNVN